MSRSIRKSNGQKEKREFLRFECCLPADVLDLEGECSIVKRATVRDISCEGLKLTISFNINYSIDPGSNIKLRLYCPEKKLFTSMSGEIIWNKCADNRLELGLKIKSMDKNKKSELLNWIFPRWIKAEMDKSRDGE